MYSKVLYSEKMNPTAANLKCLSLGRANAGNVFAMGTTTIAKVVLLGGLLCFSISNSCQAQSNTETAKPKKPSASSKRPNKVIKGASLHPLAAFELARYQYCGTDADCIIAQNGCCDCANGGEDVAINKDRAAAFQARFDCLHVSCGDLEKEPACASGVVTCINHKCRYITDELPAPKKR